jgi:hypothetical protein
MVKWISRSRRGKSWHFLLMLTRLPVMISRHSFSLCRSAFGWDGDRLNALAASENGTNPEDSSRELVIDTTMRDPLTGTLPWNEKKKLRELLGEWEEPSSPTDHHQVFHCKRTIRFCFVPVVAHPSVFMHGFSTQSLRSQAFPQFCGFGKLSLSFKSPIHLDTSLAKQAQGRTASSRHRQYTIDSFS